MPFLRLLVHKVQALFPATMDRLYDMLAFISEFSLQKGLSHQDVDHLQLAAEEAIVNIISYGYPQERKGEIDITCESIASRCGVKITLQDFGVPFNPLERPPQKERFLADSSDQEKNRVGGYGIYILVGLMDSVDYKREDNKNQLVLTKYASKSGHEPIPL